MKRSVPAKVIMAILLRISTIISRLKGLFLFGDFSISIRNLSKIKGGIDFGKGVIVSSNVRTKGRSIIVEDDVFIHENVLIRSLDEVIIRKGTTINRNTSILDNVQIGEFCSIGPNCVIVGSNHNTGSLDTLIKDQGYSSLGIKIDDDVWLGANVSILDGVEIGKGAVVAAGSVVTKNVEAYTIVAGIPARKLKSRNNQLP